MACSRPILVAGVGNWLLSDDGIGVHAARELEQRPMAGVTIADLGTAILHGLSFLEAAERVLLIDAVQGGQPPGTIYHFEPTTVLRAAPPRSIHARGWREAIQWLPPGNNPPAVTVIGVEPQSLAYGTELSAPCRAALPELVALARRIVDHWLAEFDRENLLEPSTIIGTKKYG